MTVRTTSIDAYRQIEEMGLLRHLQWQVYSYLFWHGPLTSGEVYYKKFRRNGAKQRVPSQIRARFTELRDMGVLREVGERPCKVTGHRCIVWDVTDSLPGKRTRFKGWKALAMRLQAALREQVKIARRYKRWVVALAKAVNRPARWYEEKRLPQALAAMVANAPKRSRLTTAQKAVIGQLFLRQCGRSWVASNRLLAHALYRTLESLMAKGLVECRGRGVAHKARLTASGLRRAMKASFGTRRRSK